MKCAEMTTLFFSVALEVISSYRAFASLNLPPEKYSFIDSWSATCLRNLSFFADIMYSIARCLQTTAVLEEAFEE
jgi:hypothetical protein